MRVLLDTCVLSELRHPQGHTAIKSNVASIPADSLFLSVLTVGEITKGIGLLPASTKKNTLSSWLYNLESLFHDRILPIELETVHIWGDLSARCQKFGISISAIDGLLAATALKYGMHLMTRNTRHFKSSGVIIIDPWETGAAS